MEFERLVKRVDELREWCTKLLERMVSVPTVNPPGTNFEEFVNLVAEELRSMGIDASIHRVPREVVEKVHGSEIASYPRYVLIARVGSGSKVLQINGHYDVVPPGDGWTKDPFKPVIENGRLYGRGSVDMKGGIASALTALATLKDFEKELNGVFEVALVPDEEIGGESGTGYMLDAGLSRPSYAIIAEPSGVDQVWIGHRGAVWCYVEVRGRQAHGSTPWLGINAFRYGTELARRFFERYLPMLEQRRSRYAELYEDPNAAMPTANIGGEIRGGAKINIVPAFFSFSIDRRLIIEEKPEEVEEEIRRFVEENTKDFPPEVKVSVRFVGRMPPTFVDPKSELVRNLIDAAKNALGLEPLPRICTGGLDLWFYTTRGIPCITYGPGPRDTPHMADEYVELEQVYGVAKVFAILGIKLLS